MDAVIFPVSCCDTNASVRADILPVTGASTTTRIPVSRFYRQGQPVLPTGSAGSTDRNEHVRLSFNHKRHQSQAESCCIIPARHFRISFKSIDEISDEEWELTFKGNIHAMFYLAKAAVPHMKPGSCIINTASINSDAPNPTLLAYATTTAAIHNFTAGLAQMLAEKGIRASAVAPGPIWTPLY